MKKIYFLSTCNTCKRIINELDLDSSFEMQDIKVDRITKPQLERMRSLTDSYDSLFSRRSRKYTSLGLKNVDLSEDQMKDYILEEYTFLKRPVIIINDFISIGSSKKEIEKVKELL